MHMSVGYAVRKSVLLVHYFACPRPAPGRGPSRRGGVGAGQEADRATRAPLVGAKRGGLPESPGERISRAHACPSVHLCLARPELLRQRTRARRRPCRFSTRPRWSCCRVRQPDITVASSSRLCPVLRTSSSFTSRSRACGRHPESSERSSSDPARLRALVSTAARAPWPAPAADLALRPLRRN